MDDVRITLAVAQMLRVFYEDPDRDWYGYDLMSATGFASGKIYPILARLTTAGWLLPLDPGPESKSGGSPRISYRLAPEAVSRVARELTVIDRSIRLPRPPPA